MYKKYGYIFQQDGASPHMTNNTIDFIEKHAKVDKYDPQPNNKDELEEALKVIWLNILQEKIDNLIQTFKYRLEMCTSVFGGNISHFLSVGRKKVKATDIIDKDFISYLLTNDDNIQLYL